MRNHFRLFSFLALIFFNAIAHAGIPLGNSIAPMLEKTLPAVVNIKAQLKLSDLEILSELQKQQRKDNPNNNDNNPENPNPPNMPPNPMVSVASGVIVDANKGYILTNAHVIDNAQTVIVTLGDNRHYNAKIIGIDKPSDIALIQIKAKNLTALPMGDSSKLKVGDFVAAIGNPFGLNQTVTSGIISALGRTTLGIENYENFIQTDASINPGNSGGALINFQGELIGINTAILAPDRGNVGIGFAIPINMAKSVMLQLLEYGNVQRGALGIGAQDITPELANALHLKNTQGAAVTQVFSDSPAQKAGMLVGDIITAVNGVQIKNASDVVNTIGFLRVNSKITINILRNGKPIQLSASLIDPKMRKEHMAQTDPFLYGVGLKDFSILSPTHGNVKGVIVVGVEEDTNAWRSDLKPGDIITFANQQRVTNIDELKAITAKANTTLVLNVLRGPGAIFLVINKENE